MSGWPASLMQHQVRNAWCTQSQRRFLTCRKKTSAGRECTLARTTKQRTEMLLACRACAVLKMAGASSLQAKTSMSQGKRRGQL